MTPPLPPSPLFFGDGPPPSCQSLLLVRPAIVLRKSETHPRLRRPGAHDSTWTKPLQHPGTTSGRARPSGNAPPAMPRLPARTLVLSVGGGVPTLLSGRLRDTHCVHASFIQNKVFSGACFPAARAGPTPLCTPTRRTICESSARRALGILLKLGRSNSSASPRRNRRGAQCGRTSSRERVPVLWKYPVFQACILVLYRHAV